MYIKHPTEQGVINASKWEYIHACTVNLTHVDFYREAPKQGDQRGEPDFIVVFETQEARDGWFNLLKELMASQ